MRMSPVYVAVVEELQIQSSRFLHSCKVRPPLTLLKKGLQRRFKIFAKSFKG